METENQVTLFMQYIYNKWTLNEATTLFGSDLGYHIYGKFINAADKLFWYSQLDDEVRDKIVKRALWIYRSLELKKKLMTL
jgi:hypothetical protein